MSATARYGDPAAALAVDSDVLSSSSRTARCAGSAAEVTDDELAGLVAAAQSAPRPPTSSRGASSRSATPSPEGRGSPTLAADQDFVAQAPLFLVWIADLGRARRLAERAEVPLDATDYLESTVIGFVDTALAAQNAVPAASRSGWAVFVGAIRNHPEEVAAELGLPPHAAAAFGLVVGAPDPPERRCEAAAPAGRGAAPRAVRHRGRRGHRRVRRAAVRTTTFWLIWRWSDRVLTRLAGPQSMAGRHALREALERLGCCRGDRTAARHPPGSASGAGCGVFRRCAVWPATWRCTAARTGTAR